MNPYRILIPTTLILLLLTACQQPTADLAPTFSPPTYRPSPTVGPYQTLTYTVAYGDVVDALETRGRVEARREANLLFTLDGTLKTLDVAAGDQVTRGSLLAELSVPAVESEALTRRHALDLAELQVARAGVISITQIANAQAAVAETEATYDQVELQGTHAVANARISASRCWKTAKDDVDQQLCSSYVPQAQANAEASLAVAAARRDAARRTLSLARSLQDLDLAIARVQLAQAETLYLQTAQQVSSTQLSAPFSGVMLSVEKRAGDSVSAYETIGVLADPTELWVIATVFEQDAHRIAIGQRVSVVLDAYLDQTYDGTVLQIASQAVLWQGKWAYEVTITFDEGQGVPATMRMGADVSIVVRSKENVLLIPTQAILVSGGREYVELIEAGGAVQQIEIQTGISNGIETEVIFGLEEGQTIRIP